MTQSMSGVDSIAHSGTPPAGASFGASLRALREARGWSVGDVSARLKFVPRQIEAIEADRWEDLPQGPSLRGLVRNYARLLDQDPEVMMRAIPAHLQHQPQSNPHLRNTVATDISASAPLERWGGTGARRRRAWFAAILWLIVICVVALAVYLVVAWWLPRMGNGGGNGQETLMPFDTPARSSAPAVTGQIVTPPASTTPAPAPVPAPAAPAETAPSAAGAPAVTPAAPGAPATVPSGAPEGSIAGPNGAAVAEVQAQQAQAQSAAATPGDAPAPATTKPNQVAFSVTTASWVEVRDANGTIVLSSTLQPGAQTSVEAAPPARVVIGNATGVQLQWQGAAVDLAPFRRGNVARLTLE